MGLSVAVQRSMFFQCSFLLLLINFPLAVQSSSTKLVSILKLPASNDFLNGLIFHSFFGFKDIPQNELQILLSFRMPWESVLSEQKFDFRGSTSSGAAIPRKADNTNQRGRFRRSKCNGLNNSSKAFWSAVQCTQFDNKSRPLARHYTCIGSQIMFLPM